jgi:hypothetical protein
MLRARTARWMTLENYVVKKGNYGGDAVVLPVVGELGEPHVFRLSPAHFLVGRTRQNSRDQVEGPGGGPALPPVKISQ